MPIMSNDSSNELDTHISNGNTFKPATCIFQLEKNKSKVTTEISSIRQTKQAYPEFKTNNQVHRVLQVTLKGGEDEWKERCMLKVGQDDWMNTLPIILVVCE
jgi:hypothetical protein